MYLLHGVSYSFLKCIFYKLIFSNRQVNSLLLRAMVCLCKMYFQNVFLECICEMYFQIDTCYRRAVCYRERRSACAKCPSNGRWNVSLSFKFWWFLSEIWSELHSCKNRYTCRARVPQTGELEERDIRLDVQVIIMIVIVLSGWSWMPS